MADRDCHLFTYATDGNSGFIPVFRLAGRGLEKLRNARGDLVYYPTKEQAELAAARELVARINGGRTPQQVVVRPRNPLPAAAAEKPPAEPVKVARRRTITVDVRRAPGANRELVEVFGKFR